MDNLLDGHFLYAPDDEPGATEPAAEADTLEAELDAFASGEADNPIDAEPEPEPDTPEPDATTAEAAAEGDDGEPGEPAAEDDEFAIPEKFANASTEDVIKAYLNVETKIAEQGAQVGTYKQQLEAVQKELEALKSKAPAPDEEGQAEDKPGDTQENQEGWTQEQSEEYDRLFYDESPAVAARYAQKVEAQIQEVRTERAVLEREIKEASEHNSGLALSRARELLYQSAQATGNKKLMDKYGNDSYRPSLEEIEANDDVYQRFVKEAQYVEEMYQRQPIKRGDKVLSPEGKYNPNVFRDAYRALYYDDDVDKAKISTAEQLANDINKNNRTGPTILQPEPHSKASAGVQWTGNEDSWEAARKAEAIDPDALEAELDDL
jgi:hypothetical protein